MAAACPIRVGWRTGLEFFLFWFDCSFHSMVIDLSAEPPCLRIRNRPRLESDKWTERGRHPLLHFRGLLRLPSRYGLQNCWPAQRRTLSRGFETASYPTAPLGSYHVSPTTTWVDPS